MYSETICEPESAQTLYARILEKSNSVPYGTALVEIGANGVERKVNWKDLCNMTERMAVRLSLLGVKLGSRVAVALPNGIPTVIATLACWHLGACTYFLSHELVNSERMVLLKQIQPTIALTSWKNVKYPAVNVNNEMLDELPLYNTELSDMIPNPGKAVTTGGSTGIPKIVIDDAPLLFSEDDFKKWSYISGIQPGNVQLICGSLHHSLFNNSFYLAMAMGCTNVLMGRFEENAVIKNVRKFGVNVLVLVPIMMSRIIQCKNMDASYFDSITSMVHAGASCPVWLKREWINILGAKKIREFYSMSEKIGMTSIRGDEWLLHPGSVGRPVGADIYIYDDKGELLPPENIGNIYFYSNSRYITHYMIEGQRRALPARSNAVSVGDLGYVDDEGYLFIVDRRSDMIVSGGKNIYASEVENTLREFHQIRDILVIGLTDETWGRRVHALIEPACDPKDFSLYELASFGFQKMSNYKLPKTIELVTALPRDASGKIRRSALVEERENTENAEERFCYQRFPDGHQLYAWKARKKKIKSAENTCREQK